MLWALVMQWHMCVGTRKSLRKLSPRIIMLRKGKGERAEAGRGSLGVAEEVEAGPHQGHLRLVAQPRAA